MVLVNDFILKDFFDNEDKWIVLIYGINFNYKEMSQYMYIYP